MFQEKKRSLSTTTDRLSTDVPSVEANKVQSADSLRSLHNTYTIKKW